MGLLDPGVNWAFCTATSLGFNHRMI